MTARQRIVWMVVGVLGMAALPTWGATVEESWAALGSKDAKTAEEAETALVGGGDAAAKFMAAKLLEEPDAKEVATLIQQLDDDQFKVREAAQERLLQLGKGVEKSLQEAAGKTDSAEVSARLKLLVEKLQTMRRPLAEEDQRQVRGVRIIAARGAGAEEYLKQIAAGAAWESTRREALVARDRLARQGVDEMIAAAAKSAAAGEDTSAQAEKIRARMKEANVRMEGAEAAMLARLPMLEKAAAERKKLETTLAADAKDAKTRTALVTLLLVELDEAGAAAKAAAGGEVEESVKRSADLAARPLAKLTMEEREELARYYLVAAKMSAGAGTVSALNHAGTLLALCLADKTLEAGQQATLENELAAVQADLAKLNGEDGWISALTTIKLDHDVVAGMWVREKEGLTVSAGEFSLMNLPVKMPESYELKVRLTRRGDGSEGVFVGFPVGKARANLNIGGWTNTATGLETIDGKGADTGDGTVRRDGGIDNDTAYEYLVRVVVKGEIVSITVTENGKPLAKWEGKESALSCHTAWQVEKQTGVSIGAHESEVFFEKVQVKKIGAE